MTKTRNTWNRIGTSTLLGLALLVVAAVFPLAFAQADSPIHITKQPEQYSYMPGESVTFSVEVENPDDYTYQWYVQYGTGAWQMCRNKEDTPLESTSKPVLTTAAMGWGGNNASFKCTITSKTDASVFVDTDSAPLVARDAAKFWDPFLTVGSRGVRPGQTLELPDGGSVSFSEDTYSVTMDHANIKFGDETLWPMDWAGVWVYRYFEGDAVKPVYFNLLGENKLTALTDGGSGIFLFDLAGMTPPDDQTGEQLMQKAQGNLSVLTDTNRSNDKDAFHDSINEKHTLRSFIFTGDANSSLTLSGGDLGVNTLMDSGAQLVVEKGATLNLSNIFTSYGITVQNGGTLNLYEEGDATSIVYGHSNVSDPSSPTDTAAMLDYMGYLFGAGSASFVPPDGGNIVVSGASRLTYRINRASGRKSQEGGIEPCYGLRADNSIRVSENSTFAGTLIYDPQNASDENLSNMLIVAAVANNTFDVKNSTVDLQTQFVQREDLKDVLAVGAMLGGMGVTIEASSVNASVDTTPVNSGFVVAALRSNSAMHISGGSQVRAFAKSASTTVDGILSKDAMTIINSNVTGIAEGKAAANGIGTLKDALLTLDITDERYQVTGTAIAQNNEARGLAAITQTDLTALVGYDEAYTPSKIKLLHQAAFLLPNKRAAVLNQAGEVNYDLDQPLSTFIAYETVYDKNEKMKAAASVVVGVPKKYTVALSATENGKITASAAAAEAGETIALTVEQASGYHLTQIQVNGAPLVGTSFVMPDKDVTITAQFDKIAGPAPAPQPPVGKQKGFASGTSNAWKKGSTGGLSLRVEKDVSQFYGVILDGAVLNSGFYTVTSGSTVVTLHANYLSTLAPGKHAVRILFLDGDWAEMDFTVGSKGGSTVARVPVTGDAAQPVVLALLALASLGGMVAVQRRRSRQ